jgi:hypothetical protein
MLRIVSFVVAVAAILAIPLTQADARHASMGGMRMGSHMSSMRVGPRVSSFNSFRSVNVIGPRRAFIAGHRIHHRRFPFFVGVGAYGLYDTCWRWVPSVYGYRRVWVCDPYGYY